MRGVGQGSKDVQAVVQGGGQLGGRAAARKVPPGAEAAIEAGTDQQRLRGVPGAVPHLQPADGMNGWCLGGDWHASPMYCLDQSAAGAPSDWACRTALVASSRLVQLWVNLAWRHMPLAWPFGAGNDWDVDFMLQLPPTATGPICAARYVVVLLDQLAETPVGRGDGRDMLNDPRQGPDSTLTPTSSFTGPGWHRHVPYDQCRSRCSCQRCSFWT